MNSLHHAILTLRRQRKQTERTLMRIDAALDALGTGRKTRHVSAVARRRMSIAQKKRWAKRR